MSTPRKHGQQDAAVTTNAPTTQTLLNAGYTQTQVAQYFAGYDQAKEKK